MQPIREYYDKLVELTGNKWLDEVKWLVSCHERALKSGDFKPAAFFYLMVQKAVEYVEHMLDSYGEFGLEAVESFLLDRRMDVSISAVHEHQYYVLRWMVKESEEISDFVFMFDDVMSDLEVVEFLLSECGMSVPSDAMEAAIGKGLDEFVSLARKYERREPTSVPAQ